MNVWLKLTMDDFVWLLGSFVVSRDIVFDWYAMFGGAFIKQQFFYERWLSFLFGGLVAINFMTKGTHLRPCLHGTPGRWDNPPSRGRKIKRVYMHSYNPGVLGWGFLRLLLRLQLRSLSRGIPSSHLEKDESLILGHICIYSWKRHALCYAVFGFARSFLPWKRPRLGGLPPPWHVYMANCHPGWQFTLPGRPGNPPRRVTSPLM